MDHQGSPPPLWVSFFLFDTFHSVIPLSLRGNTTVSHRVSHQEDGLKLSAVCDLTAFVQGSESAAL